MLEKPDLSDAVLTAALRAKYGLNPSTLAFLPLGADVNTAVYRAETQDRTAYFVKLRRGVFDELSVALPHYLYSHGAASIIPPYASTSGKLWEELENFKLVVYPFVEGRSGFQVEMTDRRWQALGAALQQIHAAAVPGEITGRMRRELFSPQAREMVRTLLEQVVHQPFLDSPAARMAAFLISHHSDVIPLLERAGELARILQSQSLEFVVCHSDVHAGNILIDADEHLYIVDWDDPILAPKERDLMFPGGGQGFRGYAPHEEEASFYQGYGPVQVNPQALAYYRYERIIQDIAAFGAELLLTNEGGADREQSLGYFLSNFEPGGTLEIAYQSDQTQTGS